MIKLTIAILAAALLAGCGSLGKRTEKRSERTILSGGYTQQRPLDDTEHELFRQVMAEMDGVSYTPESVATQVVAGRNYRFVCKAKTVTRRPETYKAEVIIFQPLPGRGDAKVSKITRL